MSGDDTVRFVVGVLIGAPIGVIVAHLIGWAAPRVVEWLRTRYSARAWLRRVTDWIGITPKPLESDDALRERLRAHVFSHSVASTRAEIAFMLNSIGCDGYMSEKDCILYVVPRSLAQWPDETLGERLPMWIDLKVVRDRERVPAYATALKRRTA